jgi:hypothetical protein
MSSVKVFNMFEGGGTEYSKKHEGWVVDRNRNGLPDSFEPILTYNDNVQKGAQIGGHLPDELDVAMSSTTDKVTVEGNVLEKYFCIRETFSTWSKSLKQEFGNYKNIKAEWDQSMQKGRIFVEA